MKKRILNTDEKLQNNSNEIITVKANSQLLHPLTCTWISTKIDKKDICLTKYNYQNNNFTFSKEQKCKDNNNYAKYLYLPPVGISPDIILKIYEINDIDSLNDWINTNIDMINILTINRIINCWIINNINILKKHNKFLVQIYNKLILKYANRKILNKINHDIIDLDIETLKFIEYWINKINVSDFKIDLLEDYNMYLEKKYTQI
jgi:hypothetical protein